MKKTGRNQTGVTIGEGILKGATLGLGLMFSGAAVITFLLGVELIAVPALEYGVLIVIIASTMIGTAVGAAVAKRQILMLSFGIGTAIFVVMLSITALFFGGEYCGVAVTLLVIEGSALAATFLASRYLIAADRSKKNSKIVKLYKKGM